MSVAGIGETRAIARSVGRGQDQKPTDRFFGRSNVLVTPHIGGVTLDARPCQVEDVVRQVASMARGDMPTGALNGQHAARLRALTR